MQKLDSNLHSINWRTGSMASVGWRHMCILRHLTDVILISLYSWRHKLGDVIFILHHPIGDVTRGVFFLNRVYYEHGCTYRGRPCSCSAGGSARQRTVGYWQRWAQLLRRIRGALAACHAADPWTSLECHRCIDSIATTMRALCG